LVSTIIEFRIIIHIRFGYEITIEIDIRF